MRVATTSRVINKSSQTPQPERRNIHTLQNESYLSYSVTFERLEKFLPVRSHRVKTNRRQRSSLLMHLEIIRVPTIVTCSKKQMIWHTSGSRDFL